MRLTCPNCDAEYEVPDDVVPEEGRDVQCSNCGKTWFQHHPDYAPDEDANALARNSVTEDEEQAPPRETLADIMDQDDEEDEDDIHVPAAAKPSEVDPAVADILRQEAETELQARRNSRSETLESQPDLGLPDGDAPDESGRRVKEARDRMARMRGEPEAMSDADVNAAAVSSRRDLLPDIDEINSTLRTDNNGASGAEGQAQVDAPSEMKRKRGFRRGFMWILILIILLVLLYIYAPRLAEAVPALEAPLATYVNLVDQLRVWLDGRVQGALRWLDDTAASQSGS